MAELGYPHCVYPSRTAVYTQLIAFMNKLNEISGMKIMKIDPYPLITTFFDIIFITKIKNEYSLS